MHVLAGAVNQPPSVGLDVHRQLFQERGGAAHGIGTDAALWQFGEEWQMRTAEFAADDPRGQRTLEYLQRALGASNGGRR
jgi:hypothetical protein